MSVIVLILKIAGLILLALLALILLVLILVLVVPVRYRIQGVMEGQASVKVKITWLLHLVTWSATYMGGDLETVLCICGIRLGKKQTESDDLMKEELTSQVEKRGDAECSEAVPEDVEHTEDIVEQTTAEEADEQEERPDKEQRAGPKRSPNQHLGIADRIRAYFIGLRQKLFRIKETLLEIFSGASSVRELVTDEANHTAFACIFQELGYLLRHFRFRRVKVDTRFALADPAATGQAFGMLSVLPFLYQYSCRVIPDFESETAYVQGNFQMIGRARGVHAVISLLRLLRKREVRMLTKKVLHR